MTKNLYLGLVDKQFREPWRCIVQYGCGAPALDRAPAALLEDNILLEGHFSIDRLEGQVREAVGQGCGNRMAL